MTLVAYFVLILCVGAWWATDRWEAL